MEQEKKDKFGTPWYIVIGSVISIFFGLYLTITRTTTTDIAEFGAVILLILFLVGAYLSIKVYLYKTRDNNNIFIRYIVPLVFCIALSILFDTMANNFDSMFVLGVIGLLMLIGYGTYKIFKKA